MVADLPFAICSVVLLLSHRVLNSSFISSSAILNQQALASGGIQTWSRLFCDSSRAMSLL